MTRKADFNAEEWSTVVEGPLFAGLKVVASHRGGTIRESLAIGRVYTEARKAKGDSEFLDDLVSSPPALDPKRVQSKDQMAEVSRERLAEALRVVEGKVSPEEAKDYRAFIMEVAQAAAEAHKEGGFIGIGGKPVSPEEQAALDELRASLEAPGT